MKNSPLPARTNPNSEKGTTRKKTRKPEPVRPRLSQSQVRARLAELKNEKKVEKFEHAKKMNARRLQSNSYMNEEVDRTPIKHPPKKIEAGMVGKEGEEKGPEEVLANSDLAANDPTSTDTQEKLKTVLSMGSFSFSEKERAVLGKVLGQ